MKLAVSIAALTVLIAVPASARELVVAPDKGWQHAATEVILMPTLVGFPRVALSDSGDAELDVSAQFEPADKTTSLTIYIFKPAFDSVPVWFDRAEAVLSNRDTYGGVTPATPEPVAFARPGTSITAGLRRVYATQKGPYRATGLAVMPVGEWLVAIRLSSIELDAVGLDDQLSKVIAAIRFPATAPAATAAQPVAACAEPPRWGKAKQRKPDMMQALLGSALQSAVADHEDAAPPGPPARLCRAGPATVTYGAYRAEGEGTGYLIAVADSGRTITVDPTLAALGVGKPGYGVALHDQDGSAAIYPEFDRLPPPEQVMEAVMRSNPISRVDGSARGNVTLTVPVGR